MHAQKLASIEQQLGFDKPVMVNYATWAKGIFVGRDDVYVDGKTYPCPAPCLGISIMSGNTVWNDLKQKFPGHHRPGRGWSHALPDHRGVPRGDGSSMAGYGR